MSGRLQQLVLLLPVLFSDVACSYAFVHGPRAPNLSSENARGVQQATPRCTSSNAAPIVDTVLGSALVGFGATIAIAAAASHSPNASPSTGFLLSSPSSSSNDSSWEAAGIAVTAGVVAVGTLFLASAVTGYGRTADCRRTREAAPAGPVPAARYLLDVQGIAQARAAGGS